MLLLSNYREARIYVRELAAWSEADQEARCRAVAEASGLRCVVYRESQDPRAEWLRALNPRSVAMVARLDVLAGSLKGDKVRPSLDLLRALEAATAQAGLVCEAVTGATSADPVAWASAVATATGRVVTGRKLVRKQARSMAKKSADARRAKSVIAKWQADTPEAEERRNYWRAAVWQSRAYENEEAAQRALPEELHAVSTRSLRRIFKQRVAPRKAPKHKGKR